MVHFIYHFIHSVEQCGIEQSWSVDSNFVLYFGQDFSQKSDLIEFVQYESSKIVTDAVKGTRGLGV